MHHIQLVFTIHARVPKLTTVFSSMPNRETLQEVHCLTISQILDFHPVEICASGRTKKRVADLLCNPFLIITQELLHSYKSIPGILILHISQHFG